MRKKAILSVFLFVLIAGVAFNRPQAIKFNAIYAKFLRLTGTGLQMEGNKIDLDADRDTSIIVSTDDQVDFEVAGSDVMTLTSTSLIVPIFKFAQQSSTVTATFIITPVASYVVMTSSSEFSSSTTTPVITTTAIAGQVLILLNGNASDILNLDGVGGTVSCKANIAIGAGDTVTLIYESTDAVWYCLSNRDNS